MFVCLLGFSKPSCELKVAKQPTDCKVPERGWRCVECAAEAQGPARSPQTNACAWRVWTSQNPRGESSEPALGAALVHRPGRAAPQRVRLSLQTRRRQTQSPRSHLQNGQMHLRRVSFLAVQDFRVPSPLGLPERVGARPRVAGSRRPAPGAPLAADGPALPAPSCGGEDRRADAENAANDGRVCAALRHRVPGRRPPPLTLRRVADSVPTPLGSRPPPPSPPSRPLRRPAPR